MWCGSSASWSCSPNTMLDRLLLVRELGYDGEGRWCSKKSVCEFDNSLPHLPGPNAPQLYRRSTSTAQRASALPCACAAARVSVIAPSAQEARSMSARLRLVRPRRCRAPMALPLVQAAWCSGSSRAPFAEGVHHVGPARTGDERFSQLAFTGQASWRSGRSQPVPLRGRCNP